MKKEVTKLVGIGVGFPEGITLLVLCRDYNINSPHPLFCPPGVSTQGEKNPLSEEAASAMERPWPGLTDDDGFSGKDRHTK